MSQNIFQIDPIFFLSIDFEETSKISSEVEEESQKQNSKLLKAHIEKNKKNIKKYNTISKMIQQMKILLQKEVNQALDLIGIKNEKSKKKKFL